MSTQLIQPLEGKKYVLNSLGPGIGGDYYVRLFKNNHVVGNTSVFADMTQADFSGYADQLPSWSAAADNGSGDAERHTGTLTFTHNGGGTANTIYGLLVAPDNAGIDSKVIVAYNFPVPISMSAGDPPIVISVLKLLQGQYPLV